MEIRNGKSNREPIVVRLRQIIVQSDMSVRDIAYYSKVSVPTIYNWLALKIENPQMAKAARVARVLGYEFDFISNGRK